MTHCQYAIGGLGIERLSQYIPGLLFLRAATSANIVLQVSSRADNVSEIRLADSQKMWTEATYSNLCHVSE